MVQFLGHISVLVELYFRAGLNKVASKILQITLPVSKATPTLGLILSGRGREREELPLNEFFVSHAMNAHAES